MTRMSETFTVLKHVFADDDPHGVAFVQCMVNHGDAPNLCEEWDEENCCPTDRGIAKAERFIERARNWTPVAWKLWSLWEKFRAAKVGLTCVFCCHDWVDDSYGGPESGCMGAHCKRCGFSFHHTLY